LEKRKSQQIKCEEKKPPGSILKFLLMLLGRMEIMEPKDYQSQRMEVRGCRARGSSLRGQRLREMESQSLRG